MTDLQQITFKQLKISAADIEKLHRIKIFNVQDLIFHLPKAFEDRSRISMLNELKDSAKGIFELTVASAYSKITTNRKILNVTAYDANNDYVELIFFIFPANSWLVNKLIRGAKIRVLGTLEISSSNSFYNTPNKRVIVQPTFDAKVEKGSFTPIYSITEGLTQLKMQRIINNALTYLHLAPEFIPLNGWPTVQHKGKSYNLNDYSFKQAILKLHQPDLTDQLSEIFESNGNFMRLIAEEILALQCSLLIEKKQITSLISPVMNYPKEQLKLINDQLPFTLTKAQIRVISEIAQDMTSGFAMSRLVHGDVGSGKSIIAAFSAAITAANNYQVAILAPTDILAAQLHKTLVDTLKPLNFRIGFLSGKLKSKAKREILEQMKEHQVDIVCGTHSLFSAGVEFSNLGLIIVDEQHKFGVEQRAKLFNKQDKFAAHQLMLSATPIPRTLAMVGFNHVSLSKLDEKPPSKLPITTLLMSHQSKAEIGSFLSRTVAAGRQIYWIAPLVNQNLEQENNPLSSVDQTYDFIKEYAPNARLAIIHGQQNNDDKALGMQAFAQGEVDILIATTIVEVGVNVPNASVIIIDSAERYGLAQLHQLRGRVGRGSKDSYCILLYKHNVSQESLNRLETLKSSEDGFVIAEQDLVHRGSGDFFGTKQHGELKLKFADLVRDQDVVFALEGFAERILKEQPDLAFKLISRWFSERISNLNF